MEDTHGVKLELLLMITGVLILIVMEDTHGDSRKCLLQGHLLS